MTVPLSVNKISKSFDKKEILSDISLDINKGEIFGLIGLNGIGKTTLMKIILGLLKQDNGKVEIFGKDIQKPKNRFNINFLPEKFHPSPFLKGREFLELSLSYYGMKYSHDDAEIFAKKLDLDPDALALKITKYSKGMQQKLGLLSSFLINSPLLMLDEPMSGLDPKARINLKDNMSSYIKSGNSIFFSSHILSDIDEICDRVAILHDRKIVFLGKPEEFKKKYKNDNLERAFLKAIS